MRKLPLTILLGCALLVPIAVGLDRGASLAEATLSAFFVHTPVVSASPLGEESARFVRRRWLELAPQLSASVPSPENRYASEGDWFASVVRGL